MTAAELAHRLGAKSAGEGQWEVRCPAHDDRRASLSIGTGADSCALLKAHAGCDTGDVLAAAGLKLSDLWPERAGSEPIGSGAPRKIVAAYSYTDESGGLLSEVLRYEPKDFRQRRPDGAGWKWSLNGTRRVLYRLPELQGKDAV